MGWEEDPADISMRLVDVKYGWEHKDIIFYQFHKICHYASICPDVEEKGGAELVHILKDVLDGYNYDWFSFRIIR